MIDQSLRSPAEKAIGSDNPESDWILTPETHAASLPTEAGALKRILTETPDILKIIQRYKESDEEAVRQQARYRRGQKWLRRLAFFAVLTGLFALSLRLILHYISEYQILLVVAHAACVFALMGCATWLNRADPRGKWLAARGRAELLRISFFDRVLAAREEVQRPAELPLLPLQLAYFRRYQLDVQLRFLKGRGKQLVRSAGAASWLTAISALTAVGAIAVAVLVAADAAVEYGLTPPIAALVAVGAHRIDSIAYWSFLALVVPTFYAIIVGQHDVSEDARNGTRYLALYKNLSFLKGEAYETVRIKAEAGDKDVVGKFVELVHDLMIAEQSQWISFQGIVDHKDTILAGRSAIGLAELFDVRLGAGPPEPTQET